MNPLSRNYESNGPDVKVRGNAAHIAEKYVQLARDAHASGDSVMAENYLQHAEHYYRIVSAAQPQGLPRTDQFGQEIETEDNDGEDYAGDEQSRFDTPQYRANLQNDSGYQPRNDQQQGDRSQQGERQPRFDQQAPQQQRVDQQQAVTPGEPEGQAPGGENGNADQPLQAEGEPRRVRERRPRRRRPQTGENGSVDPDGPQPEVGELPAFITAGGGNAAE